MGHVEMPITTRKLGHDNISIYDWTGGVFLSSKGL